MKHTYMAIYFAIFLLAVTDTQAQGLLKKLKNKVEKKAEEVLDKKTNKEATNSDTSTSTSNGESTDGSVVTPALTSKPTNKSGVGLNNTTPPDVIAQLDDAETASAAKQYSEARYSLQQAMQGIEIQLGRAVLKSLPTVVSTLPADTSQDKVISIQFGWNNLTMQRIYRQGDKQLTISIGNNSAYAGMMDLYFANAAIIESSADKQNIKQVRVKGNKALIQYEDRKGYTLMMQMGQTSLIVWEGINFSNEHEVLAAANNFDIDSIKQQLGQQ